eukprot:149607-Pyramimonas_sp.AAC.1
MIGLLGCPLSWHPQGKGRGFWGPRIPKVRTSHVWDSRPPRWGPSRWGRRGSRRIAHASAMRL